MKYTLHENLSGLHGTVSNLHGFMHRRLDTGFDTKWCGFWVPPKKFLDYYGVRVNGIWLNGETLEATEYGDGLVFHHETGSLSITEHVKFPEGLPGFRLEIHIENNSDDVKAVQVGVELAVDIRDKGQDIGPEGYEIDGGSGRFTVSKDDSRLTVSSDEEFSRAGEEYMKTHYPGEEQRCFVPGNLVFRREVEGLESDTVSIDFSTSDGSFGSIDSVDQELQHDLGRVFGSSIDSMENLIYDRNGKGVIAGHPWFQSYWARDSFWTLMGLIDAGYFQLSQEILENFAEEDVPGKIKLEDGGEDTDRCDTAPLFIVAADKLRRHYKISEKIENAMEDAMSRLELENGIVQHSAEGTWMDTLERKPAVEIQSLWVEAAEIREDEREEELRKGLEEFTDSGRILDSTDGDAETVNTAIPLMFGQLDETAEEQLSRINGEFTSRYGARTRALSDPGYETGGYHTGSTWPLATSWAAAANFRHGNGRHGRNLLEKTAQLLDRDQPGALPELVNSESGELLGCPEQAWSAGMFVHVVDTYLLGIKVHEDHIRIDPVGDVNAERRGKRVRGEKLDLKFEDGDVTVMNDPDLDLRI
ncbi:MAG: amylo-alpha-1,6-glucosidase [Candidatus Nanohaloarchaea archaeon]